MTETAPLKTHRHYTPIFKGVLPNIVAVKRFVSALNKHNWNRNKLIYKLRCKRNQRVSVRSERRETFNALALAIVANCDYNPDSDYLFEVMCSVEDLAKQCGQLYIDDNGRKTYDPVLNAIADWEAAGILIKLKGFDPDTKQQKAMRIWLKPEFFDMLGFSIKELRDIVTKFRGWMEKKGLRKTYKTRYSDHIAKIARSNVASIDDKYSLKKLLKKIKRHVLGRDAKQQEIKENLISEFESKIKEANKKLEKQMHDDVTAFSTIYLKWKTTQPLSVYYPIESETKKLHPDKYGEELYKLYLERIKEKGL